MAKKNLTGKALAATAALTLTLSSLGQSAAVLGTKVNAAETDNYAKLLQASLFFYDANMCGKTVESDSLMSWRGNCHTFCEVDGGYHDAGDHAMFGLPQGYTASTLGWAYYEFKDSFDSLGLTAHYKTINDHFATFFKNATVLNGDSVSKICIQKGIGNTDHSYWGAPEKQGSGEFGGCDWRTSGCGDIAAEYAASLAASYVNFGNEDDLKYAKALYNYAKNNQSCSDGDCTGFYKSNSSNDDIAWAATWLYIATKDAGYKSGASGIEYDYWVHGWSNVNEGVLILGAENGIYDWSVVNSYLSGYNGSGYYFLDKWGSARLNCSAQMCALVANKHGKGNDLASWAKGQMSYVLGQNPANTCFVIGYASNSAKNPHHRAASGYQGYGEFNTEGFATASPSNSHSLIGALVGGPSDQGGTYQDNMNDYVCNEVALDYNAGLVGAAAGLYSVYKTGTVAASFDGTKNNGVKGGGTSTPATPTPTAQTPAQTPTPTAQTPAQTPTPTAQTPTQAPATKAPSTGANGGTTVNIGKKVVYSELGPDDKMIEIKYADDLGLTASDKISKIEINISTTKGSIGKWQGAFGTSTTDANSKDPYWYMTDEMSESISGNSGTITWAVDSDVQKIIQTQYGGSLKFGVWWIDCDEFTIDSVTVYTAGGSSSVSTPAPTTTPTVTPTVTPTKTPTPTPTVTPTQNNNNTSTKGDADANGVVNTSDYMTLINALIGKTELSAEGKKNADMNDDGRISILDVILLKNKF